MPPFGGGRIPPIDRPQSVADTAIVKAIAVGADENRVGIYAQSDKTWAGFFNGDVFVAGDVQLSNADVAEDFSVNISRSFDPGMVMVFGNEGTLEACSEAYDKRVAGVISGAGNYKPGIVLDKQNPSIARVPIALMGKVFCKVDTQYGPINVGDLLTTSPTPGHAMKGTDPIKGCGAVIGKALQPCQEGENLVPILVALQ
jgi:hypothetical protein